MPSKSKPGSPKLLAKRLNRSPQKLSLTIDPDVVAQVDARGEARSTTISQDLGRYYRLLADARARLRQLLTPNEIAAIVDIQNGHWYQQRLDAMEIVANVEDGCRLDGLDAKWEIDGKALVAKLEALDLLAVHALADATIRFWHAVGDGDHSRDPKRAID